MSSHTETAIATSTLFAAGISPEAGLVFVFGIILGSGATHLYHLYKEEDGQTGS